MCFGIFDWTIFDSVIARADLNLPSERSCLYNSYIFHLIHLKICRLSTYAMKMCVCFWNCVSTIFDGVIAYADLNFVNHNIVSATLSTSFIIHLKVCRLPSYDMKVCMWIRIFD